MNHSLKTKVTIYTVNESIKFVSYSAHPIHVVREKILEGFGDGASTLSFDNDIYRIEHIVGIELEEL